MCFETISARTDRVLRTNAAGKPLSPPGWKSKSGEVVKDGILVAVTVTHTLADRLIEVYSEGGVTKCVTVNLARLYHGSHGALLKSDEEIAAAWKLLDSKLDEICCPRVGLTIWWPTRLDVGWNFATDYKTFTAPLRTWRHKWVTTQPLIYRTGVVWKGGDGGFQLRVYDKARLMKVRHVKAVRVEAQYGRGKLHRALGAGFCFDRPTWELGTRLLRDALYVMQPKLMYEGEFDLPELLALCRQYKFNPLGGDTFDLWAAHRSPATVNRYRKRGAEFTATLSRFDWRALIPEGSWPPPVEVMPPSRFPGAPRLPHY